MRRQAQVYVGTALPQYRSLVEVPGGRAESEVGEEYQLISELKVYDCSCVLLRSVFCWAVCWRMPGHRSHPPGS